MMGNRIWLWGKTFVFLYPSLFVNMIDPPFSQMQRMPVICFYLAENLRAVVGKPRFAYHSKCHTANSSAGAPSQLDSSGKRKRGNSVRLCRQSADKPSLILLAWVRLKACGASGHRFSAEGVNSYQFCCCSLGGELLSVVSGRENGVIKN